MSPCYAKMLSEHISFLCSILLEQRVVASRSKALNAWNSHHSSVSMYSFYMISITIIVQWLLFNRCWAIKSAKCKNSDSMQRFIVSISNLWFPSGSLLNAIIRIFLPLFRWIYMYEGRLILTFLCMSNIKSSIVVVPSPNQHRSIRISKSCNTHIY